ncbi:MAG: hypothetical protein IJN37_01545 [Clostridia bacterium]|nr:hypothetical protein [Clostridia bacterium]
MKKYRILLACISVIAVIFAILWYFAKNDDSGLYEIAHAGVHGSLEAFRRYAETGSESDYINGLADYNLFLSMAFRLEDSEMNNCKTDCNRLYGSMIITPEKVHENIDALINILEMLDTDLNNPNAYLRMNELNNLLEHGE